MRKTSWPHHASELMALTNLGAQANDFALEHLALEKLGHLEAQGFELEGFGDEIGRSHLHGLDGHGDGIGRRQDDDGDIDARLAELGEQVESVASGHDDIEEHQVGRAS